MSIYHVSGFQSGEAPHWHTAYIEADNEAHARILLQFRLSDDPPGEVWSDLVTPASEWHVSKLDAPLLFVLGGGCR